MQSNPQPIRLFACDLDGTLLNVMHDMDDIIQEGIDTVLESGRHFCAATGRNVTMCHNSGLHDVFIVGMNGAAVCAPDDTILWQDLFDKEMLKEMLEELPECRLEFMTTKNILSTFTREECLAEQNEKSRRRHRKTATTPEKMLEQYLFSQSPEEIVAADIVKVNCFNAHDENSRKLEAFLKKHADRIVSAGTDDFIFEITNQGIDKSVGVKKLAEILQIPEDQVAVYGDGGNDLGMLKAFANSYAPCSAKPEARALAGEIIGPFQDHSVIRHIVETVKQEEAAQ